MIGEIRVSMYVSVCLSLLPLLMILFFESPCGDSCPAGVIRWHMLM